MKMFLLSAAAVPPAIYFWTNLFAGNNPLIDPVYWMLGVPGMLISFWIGWTLCE